ncbi:MAG: tRNA (guanosine(46)-N7)-methyltransferase TrmB [candidate division Zixibacteria bacterium]|nr:tRNA (guanosine(46)-N7)-methyltransferase TrmB [candidate division Zixibacteria bacterium]
MGRTKSSKIAELASLVNVIQGEYDIKGRWSEMHFGNANPIVAELGCGRGDYTVELAKRFPAINFIGIDLKGARLWRGAKNALASNLINVVFLRTAIRKLEEYFAADEISEIWLTFPDPYPKRRHESLRLTSPRFLNLYRKILKPDGAIHLKTDDPDLFDYTIKAVKADGWRIREAFDDIYGKPVNNEIIYIQTKYEKQHLADGKKIRYMKFIPQ